MIAIDWECLANGTDEGQFAARLVLRNVSSAPIDPGWELYFNTCRKVLPHTVSAGFMVAHVNGDLFQLSALNAAPWLPGQAFVVMPTIGTPPPPEPNVTSPIRSRSPRVWTMNRKASRTRLILTPCMEDEMGTTTTTSMGT